MGLFLLSSLEHKQLRNTPPFHFGLSSDRLQGCAAESMAVQDQPSFGAVVDAAAMLISQAQLQVVLALCSWDQEKHGKSPSMQPLQKRGT